MMGASSSSLLLLPLCRPLCVGIRPPLAFSVSSPFFSTCSWLPRKKGGSHPQPSKRDAKKGVAKEAQRNDDEDDVEEEEEGETQDNIAHRTPQEQRQYIRQHSNEMRVRIRRKLSLMHANPYVPSTTDEDLYDAYETFRKAEPELLEELLEDAPPMYAKRIHTMKSLLESKILRLHATKKDNEYEIFWDNGMRMILKVDFGPLNRRFEMGGRTVRVSENLDGIDDEEDNGAPTPPMATRSSDRDSYEHYNNTWNGMPLDGTQVDPAFHNSPQHYEEQADPAVEPGMLRFHLLPRLFLPPLELMTNEQAFVEALRIMERENLDKILRQKRFHIKPAVARHLAAKATEYKIHRAKFFQYLAKARQARENAILQRGNDANKYW